MEKEEMGIIPFSIVDELRLMLAQIQEQQRVIQQMISDSQVARMSTDYLDLEQAAEVLHCKAKTLERIRMRGELAFYQYGKKIVVRRSDIDAFLNAHRKNDDFLKRLEEAKITELPLSYEDNKEEIGDELEG